MYIKRNDVYMVRSSLIGNTKSKLFKYRGEYPTLEFPWGNP